MDYPVVGFYLDHWEEFVGVLCGDLVHGECHFVDVNESNNKLLVTSNDAI